MRAWRICKRNLAATAFDGQGAKCFGGRWNSPGVPLVYTASSASLAILELAVHLDIASLLALQYVLIPIDFDAQFIKRIDSPKLPRNWKDSAVTRTIGDEWIRAGSSAVLCVPSAVVGVDVNYLINPAHPDFAKFEIGKSIPHKLDPRLRK